MSGFLVFFEISRLGNLMPDRTQKQILTSTASIEKDVGDQEETGEVQIGNMELTEKPDLVTNV